MTAETQAGILVNMSSVMTPDPGEPVASVSSFRKIAISGTGKVEDEPKTDSPEED